MSSQSANVCSRTELIASRRYPTQLYVESTTDTSGCDAGDGSATGVWHRRLQDLERGTPPSAHGEPAGERREQRCPRVAIAALAVPPPGRRDQPAGTPGTDEGAQPGRVHP